MKVLLTGTSGFIGSRLLDAACVEWGESNVTVLSSRQAARGTGLVYAPDYTLEESSRLLVSDTELLIHAGAFTPKSGATANDISACSGNIAFTSMLLDLPMPALRKVLYLSTVDVYAPANGPIDEDSPVEPVSLYGWSKLYCEQMVQRFGAQRGVDVGVLRIGHVFGPGEEQYAKFLPNAIRNIVAGMPVELWGEGEELRSLIYVDDVVRAVLTAASSVEAPSVINIVGSRALTVRALLERAISVSGRDVPLEQRAFSGAPRDLTFDASRLKRYLLPEETNLDDGLRAELEHMKGSVAT